LVSVPLLPGVRRTWGSPTGTSRSWRTGDKLERSIWTYEEALRARSGAGRKTAEENEKGGEEKCRVEEDIVEVGRWERGVKLE